MGLENELVHVALYIRVSTEDQIDYSPDSQKKLLLEYARKNNFVVNEEHIFVDEGISGRNADKRPEFQRMIAIAKSKDQLFQKILVWKFSRFARNQEESIVYKNMLRKDGIEVVSISEPIIEGPFGSLIERIIEWMDEYYSTRLSGEVVRGMTEKATKEGILATPPYGYRKKDGNYIVDKDEAEIIKYIFNKVIEGKGFTTICKDLRDMGVKSRRGSAWIPRRVKYCIQNPVYMGKLRWNYTTHQGGRKINDESEWIITDGTHEPIICEDDFNKANEMLCKLSYSTSKRPFKYEIRHYLSGLLRCSSCNGTLVFSDRTRPSKKNGMVVHKFYRCNNFSKGACKTSNYIRYENIERLVGQLMNKDLANISKAIATGDLKHIRSIDIESPYDNANEIQILEKQLEKVKTKYEAAKRAYLAEIDTLDEYKLNKIEISEEEKTIKNKLESLNNIDSMQNIVAMKNILEHALLVLNSNSFSLEEKNKLLKSFIKSIVIDVKRDKIRIFYYAQNMCRT